MNKASVSVISGNITDKILLAHSTSKQIEVDIVSATSSANGGTQLFVDVEYVSYIQCDMTLIFVAL